MSAAPMALGHDGISNPALPGWADVWRAGPPGLGSGWVLFCRSLTQELIKLRHCQRPVTKSSKRANSDKSESQASLRDCVWKCGSYADLKAVPFVRSAFAFTT